MEPIRVAHLVSTLGVGGQEMVILSLIRHADLARIEPRVFCLHEAGPLADRIEALGFKVELIGGPDVTGWPLVRRLSQALRDFEPHVLHTHNPAPHQHGAVARYLAGVPVLLHTKHGRNNFPTRARRWAEQAAGRFTDLVVAVSRDSAEVARTIDGVPARKLRVIHNGIDLDQFAQVQAREAEGRLRAVHVARLNRIKDQPTLLRAARLVADRLPGFTLDIVGDGPMAPVLYPLAAELGLEQVVTFHGMQTEVAPYLANADCFLLPSLSEGISITLLEAMASSLPVVATDVGGNREVVDHGNTGLLVPVGNPGLLADAICEVLTDPARAAAMGQAGRKRVAAEFNIRNTVRAYEAAYRELLGHKTTSTVQVAA